MKQTAPKPLILQRRHTRPWRLIATVTLIAGLLYVVFRNQTAAGKSVTILTHAQPGWLTAGILLSAATFMLAAAVYVQLALHPLRYWRTALIELAASFANRLLPAGLGGLGLHGLYLHRQRHTPAEATAIVSVNNLLGIAAHLSLLAGVCLLQPQLIGRFTSHWPNIPWLLVFTAGFVLAIGIYTVPGLRRRIGQFSTNLAVSFRRIPAGNLVRAFCLAILLTIAYTLTLSASARAVGVSLPLLQVFIIFSLGMLAGTATPTPGGLVGVEAGLYAGFLSYGVSATSAGAAVVVYRLLTYWLPLLPGLAALFRVRTHKYV